MLRWEALHKVTLNGAELEFLSEELRADEEVVLRAVRQDSFALEYAAPELLRSRSFALRAARINGLALQHLPAQFQADREVVREAVANVGFALRWAAPELQADPGVVELAVRRDGFALRYAAEALREEESISLAAVTQNRLALDYVPEALREHCLSLLCEMEAPATPPRRPEASGLISPRAVALGAAMGSEAARAPPLTAATEVPLITPPRPTPQAPNPCRLRIVGKPASENKALPPAQSTPRRHVTAAPLQAGKRAALDAFQHADAAGTSARKRARWSGLMVPPPWPLAAAVADAKASS